MKRLLALAAAVLFAAACAAPGPKRSDDLFGRIRTGMTQEEVRAITGPADEVMPFPLSHTTSWAWYYHETMGFYALFSVTFGPDGRVASTFVKRLNDGGSDHGK
jgi:hypothetical protein